MKFKYLIAIMILFSLIGIVHAEPFMPTNGTFAYQEVEIFEINEVNFTIPTQYNITSQDSQQMTFKNGIDTIKIKVEDGGKVKKVKGDKSKNITSGKTMFGSVEGYLVDKNGSYTFSYKEDAKLITIKSRNVPLMIGVMGKD